MGNKQLKAQSIDANDWYVATLNKKSKFNIILFQFEYIILKGNNTRHIKHKIGRAHV